MEGAAEPFQSVLRLFLSVDVVGSTAFKQSASLSLAAQFQDASDRGGTANFEEIWFFPFLQFYREIDRLFSQHWDQHGQQVAPRHGFPVGDAPKFWKAIGDEIVYYKDLTNANEARCCLHCWMEAVRAYRATLKTKYPSLDLKASAWLAGFPVTNTEIIVRSGEIDFLSSELDGDPFLKNASLLRQYYSQPRNPNLTLDFIGLSIDTGFRLGELATPRRLIISLDLALMLSTVDIDAGLNYPYPKLKFHYSGRQTLKGINGGLPYPIFWIDMFPEGELERIEDNLTGDEQRDTLSVRNFARQLIDQNGDVFKTPYISSAIERTFNQMPAQHKAVVSFLKRVYEGANSIREEIISSDKQDAGGNEPTPQEENSFVIRRPEDPREPGSE